MTSEINLVLSLTLSAKPIRGAGFKPLGYTRGVIMKTWNVGRGLVELITLELQLMYRFNFGPAYTMEKERTNRMDERNTCSEWPFVIHI